MEKGRLVMKKRCMWRGLQLPTLERMVLAVLKVFVEKKGFDVPDSREMESVTEAEMVVVVVVGRRTLEG